jgi:predicted P-loop ATPase
MSRLALSRSPPLPGQVRTQPLRWNVLARVVEELTLRRDCLTAKEVGLVAFAALFAYARALKPIHDWVKDYERTWSERFDQLDVVLENLKQKEEGDVSGE